MQVKEISFSEDSKEFVLDMLGKGLDKEGFIVEKGNTAERVLTKDGEEIHISEWGGIKKGSEEYVKSDAFSLLSLIRKN